MCVCMYVCVCVCMHACMHALCVYVSILCIYIGDEEYCSASKTALGGGTHTLVA
jgi:hypothetical protein